MPAKRIKRAPKGDTRKNGGQPKPETIPKAIVAVPVANGTTILTTPDRVEKVKSKYRYLNEF